jgi:hypothetical protein
MDSKHLTPEDMTTVRALVAHYGLRPMVNAIAKAAEELDADGKPVLDEFGDPMDEGDIQTAVANLLDGQLY